jgi:hypothetical protein
MKRPHRRGRYTAIVATKLGGKRLCLSWNPSPIRVIESARSRSLPNRPAHVLGLSDWEFGWDRITLNTSGRVRGIQRSGNPTVAAPMQPRTVPVRGQSELFSRIEGRLQIRNVQRRSWREREWRWLGATGGSRSKRRTVQSAQWFRSVKIASGLTAGRMIWIRGSTGGARFTGASASLKAVSGRSGRGTTDAQTAAAVRNRTNAKRSRFTSPHSEHSSK